MIFEKGSMIKKGFLFGNQSKQQCEEQVSNRHLPDICSINT